MGGGLRHRAVLYRAGAQGWVSTGCADSAGIIDRFPDLPEAHSILAMARAQEWNWEAAETSFRKALSLGSQHSIHRQFAVLLMTLGRMEEAAEHLQIAREMNSFSVRQIVSMARFLYYGRRHEEADSFYRDLWGRSRSTWAACWGRGAFYSRRPAYLLSPVLPCLSPVVSRC